MDRFPKKKFATFVDMVKCSPIAFELNDTDTLGASFSMSSSSASAFELALVRKLI
jgi:hypothetical protein